MSDADIRFREQLDDLRQEGAARSDPICFRYLESLTARLAGSRHPQHHRKLQQALDDFRTRMAAIPKSSASATAPPPRPSSPLAPLLQALRAGTQPLPEIAGGIDTPAANTLATDTLTTNTLTANTLAALLQQQQTDLGLLEPARRQTLPPLKAARHLRTRQARQHRDADIRRAFAGAPDNAGPLNAHRLVNRALQQMQHIAPAYLHHLAQHMETLMALEKTARKK